MGSEKHADGMRWVPHPSSGDVHLVHQRVVFDLDWVQQMAVAASHSFMLESVFSKMWTIQMMSWGFQVTVHRVQTFWQLSSSHHLDLVVASTCRWSHGVTCLRYLTMLPMLTLFGHKASCIDIHLQARANDPSGRRLTASISQTLHTTMVYNLFPMQRCMKLHTESVQMHPPLPERPLETRLQPLCKAHGRTGQTLCRGM